MNMLSATPCGPGASQWQIEGPRRLEIPEDMQKKFGFAPPGAADGPAKSAIFGENNARLYNYERHASLGTPDRFATLKDEYDAAGSDRRNLRYWLRPQRVKTGAVPARHGWIRSTAVRWTSLGLKPVITGPRVAPGDYPVTLAVLPRRIWGIECDTLSVHAD